MVSERVGEEEAWGKCPKRILLELILKKEGVSQARMDEHSRLRVHFKSTSRKIVAFLSIQSD